LGKIKETDENNIARTGLAITTGLAIIILF
jgi:hypothetical protein